MTATSKRGATKREPPKLPSAVRRYIAGARVCRVATASQGGEPHVIPLCPVFDGERTLYVDIGPEYRTAKHISANARATVLIDDYFDDWSQLRRVILRCRVRKARADERDAAWRRIRRKFPQSRAINWQPRLTLALRIEAWRQEGVVS